MYVCCVVSDSTQCPLQSANVPTCLVLRTQSSYGNRSFAATGPRQVPLHSLDNTYVLFRRQLNVTFSGRHERGAL